MNVKEQIDQYIAEQSPTKSEEIQALHRLVLRISPNCKLWFLDGKNEAGKIVSNPNIGYGQTTIEYANGDSRAFYQIGLSANTTGISVYVMGVGDKKHLSETYGKQLGKAKVTGYCIRFRSIGDLDLGILEEIIAKYMGAGAALHKLEPSVV